MIITICGPSGAGKSLLCKELKEMGVREIIPYTTRERRPGERNTVDYFFVDIKTFQNMILANEFCEYEEYSQNRFYGTSRKDIIDAAKSNQIYVTTVTPNGMRAIEDAIRKNNISQKQLLKVMVTASLGIRVKRYIDRVHADRFNFDDMNEINARVNRDFGMFLNMEKYCDLVLDNSIDQRYTENILTNPIAHLANQVLETVECNVPKIKNENQEFERT